MNAYKTEEFRYRLIYESLSRFSGNLGNCNSFSSIADCLLVDVKYIIDCNVLRILFYQQHCFISYTLTPKNCVLQRHGIEELLPEEFDLYNNSVPLKKPVDERLADNIGKKNIDVRDEPMDYWGWNFMLQPNSGIIISLINNKDVSLAKSDIAVLKLVVENLYSRLFTLKLIEELDVKRNELEATMLELTKTNETISLIIRQQDAIIEERTASLRDSNKKLLQLSKMNAHNLREPLSRILGILYILEESNIEETIHEYLPLLHQSSTDLDKAIQSTVSFIDKEITKMKAYDL